MFTRKISNSTIRRTAAIAAVAAVGLTAVAPTTAEARYRHGGGAAAAAAIAGIVGTGLAIAATQNRGYYYGSPYGAYGGPGYYASPGYYGGYGGGPYDYRNSSQFGGQPISSW
jgi:hypothetical protein